jgi:hypothetical protein
MVLSGSSFPTFTPGPVQTSPPGLLTGSPTSVNPHDITAIMTAANKNPFISFFSKERENLPENLNHSSRIMDFSHIFLFLKSLQLF